MVLVAVEIFVKVFAQGNIVTLPISVAKYWRGKYLFWFSRLLVKIQVHEISQLYVSGCWAQQQSPMSAHSEVQRLPSDVKKIVLLYLHMTKDGNYRSIYCICIVYEMSNIPVVRSWYTIIWLKIEYQLKFLCSASVPVNTVFSIYLSKTILNRVF